MPITNPPAAQAYVPAWYEDGPLTVGTQKGPRRRVMRNITLTGAYLKVKTAPTGAAIICNVKLNGTTIFTTKPQINASADTGSSTSLSITTASVGDYLDVDIDQIGSTIAGAGLTLELDCSTR